MPIFECSRCNNLRYSASPDAVRACERCGATPHRVFEGGFDDARRALRDLAESDHATLLYDDPALVAPFCARYLTEGVDSGERVICALPHDLRAATEQLLAADVAVVVEWHDPLAIYEDFDADRVAASYDDLIGADTRTARILACVDGACIEGVSELELSRYEGLAHEIVVRHGAVVICMYDTRELDAALVTTAMNRHPMEVSDGVVRRNERFEYLPA